MYTKPNTPIKFEKGKSVYAVEGLTNFMNWLCTAFFNLEGDKAHGVEVDWKTQDKPKIVVKYV